jgi:PAS domain S-box-containing protein
LAEEAVKQAEDRIRLVIDTIPTMAWSLRPDGVLDFLNQRWLDYTGLSLQEAIEEPTRTVHPQDLPRAMEKWLVVKATSEAYEDEMRLRRADGEYRWFLIRIAPLLDEHGSIVKRYGVAIDIEHRKRAEEALRKSEKLFAVFMDQLPGFAWMKDIEGRYVYVNKRESELDAYRAGVIGKTDAELWPAEIASTYRANDHQVITTRKAVQTVEPSMADGEQRSMLVSKFPIFDQNGSVVMVAGAGVDITDRIQAEEALRESETRFRQVAENISAVFWLSNPEGTLTHYVSPAYETIWGRSCDSLYAEPSSWMDSVHPDDRERLAEDERLQAIGGRHDHTYRIVRPDGSLRWIRGRAFPVRDESGKLIRVAGIAEDITERKEAVEQLEQHTHLLQTFSRRLFEVQEEERRHLARELHDEIGQALTAAKINLQSVTGNGGGANFARLQETTAILDRLLGQVRQISLDLRPSMLDDLGLVPALRSLLDQQGRRASVEVHFSAENIPEKLDPEIQTTCFRIAQEAITNAVRHAHATHIDLDLRCKNGKLRLLVRDNGIGLDVESAQAQTIGLGLIGIKERAALVGGRAKIISSPNKGTTIEVSVPSTLRPERQGRHIGK